MRSTSRNGPGPTRLHGGRRCGGQRFTVGDHVICRAPTRLRPADGVRGTEVRNGTRRTVTAISPGPTASLTVDFDNRGPIHVPTELLTKKVRGRSVIGIITHAYCLTTHAAQGDTYRTGRLLTTDTASREGVYVGLTRGEHDARLYVIACDDFFEGSRRPDDDLPAVGTGLQPASRVALRLATIPLEESAVSLDVQS